MARLAGALLPLALLGLLFAVDFPLCPFRALAGAPCPGCGLTRATAAAVQGDFSAALAFHPLVFLITPVVAWLLLRTTLVTAGLLRADSFDPLAWVPTWGWWTFALATLGVWVVRLAGGLGGHPDPIDPSSGFIGRVLSLATMLF